MESIYIKIIYIFLVSWEPVLTANQTFCIKAELLILEFLNQAKNISMVLPSSPENLRQIGSGNPDF